MSLSDRLVLRLSVGVTEGHPDGLPVAAEVLERAYDRSLISCSVLSDFSLALCVLICPPKTRLHSLALAEYLARGVTPTRVADQMRLSVGPRWALTFSEWEAVQGDAPGRDALFEQIERRFADSLATFLARVHMMPANRDDAALKLWRAFVDPDLGDALRRGVDFQSFVHRQILRTIRRDRLPDSLPAQLPSGWGSMSPGERSFLRDCMALSMCGRWVLYMVIFAELNVRQIAEALADADPPWSPATVLGIIQQVWTQMPK